MQMTTLTTFLALTSVLAVSSAFPYRATQGILRNRPSLNEVLTSYLQAAQQQRTEPQYGYPEYQPTYQHGYIANRPRRVQTIDPLVQYLNTPDLQQDYPNYDLSGMDQIYSDSDGAWYDDMPLGEPSPLTGTNYRTSSNDFLMSEPTDQDIALARLMLDHRAGKYSLEDLETLEREARIEDNTENQLRALAKQVQRKKSMIVPLIGSAAPRSVPRPVGLSRSAPRVSSPMGTSQDALLTMTQRRGQKEEPLMIPATSIRRPIFVQQLEKAQKESSHTDDEEKRVASKKSSQVESESSTSTPVAKLTTPSTGSKSGESRESGVVEVVKVNNKNRLNRPAAATSKQPISPSNSPYYQPAYEALKKYLETERQARINADEQLFKSPQKRFVEESSDPLRDQLNNLKKSVV